MVSAMLIGDEALAAKFQAAAASITGQETIWVGECGDIVMTAIEGNIMRQGLIRSGDLYDSGRLFYHTAHGISVGFGKDLGYAEPLELGSAPHEITAGAGWWSSASMLSFWWEERQDFFVGPKVNHPGNRPYRFMYNGTLESIYPIMMLFTAKLRAIFGGM